MITVSLIPIVIAAFVSVMTGWIWFHPKIFGNTYMRMSGATPEMEERGKRRMPLSVLITFLASMVVAWVMVFVGNALNEFTDVIGAIELGFWIWAGFVAPSMLGVVLWEQKPLRFYFIITVYWLINLVAIAIVLLVASHYFSGTAYPYNLNDTQQISE